MSRNTQGSGSGAGTGSGSGSTSGAGTGTGNGGAGTGPKICYQSVAGTPGAESIDERHERERFWHGLRKRADAGRIRGHLAL